MTIAVESNGVGKPADATNSGKLTSERVNSIGWLFIESYYEMYNANLENLYKLYNVDASISHGDLGKKSRILRSGNGIESIKLLFNDLAKENKNKIIIIDADIQVSLNNNILIVVNGEWSKNGSPYYQFIQTFVLCKGINESTFDIANDILRFIDVEYKHDILSKNDKQIKQKDNKTNDSKSKDIKPIDEVSPPKGEVKEVETKVEKVEQDKVEPNDVQEVKDTQESKEPKDVKETKETKDAKKTKDVKLEGDVKSSSVTEGKPESKSESTKSSTPEVNDTTTDQVTSPTNNDVEGDQGNVGEPENGSVTSNNGNNGGAMSWASLAASAKVKSPVITKSPSITKQAPPKSSSATTPPTTLPNGKYKREDWFPIYVRGCQELSEKDLKDYLSKEFGELKFFKKNANAALVDFFNREGQEKALNAKQATIKNVIISLEIREIKADTKYGRKDAKKEPNDVKRKNDKKPTKKTKP